jgi:hypothetical protein
MMTAMKAIHKTLLPASVEKIVAPANAEANTDAEADEAAPEAENLETTMSEIDKIIADVTPMKDIAKVTTDRTSDLK